MKKEYFLIVYTESGDEIHFMLMDMDHYDKVMEGLDRFANRNYFEIDNFLEFCYKNTVKSFFNQTYCTDDWEFGEYNIKKIVSLPEFGC